MLESETAETNSSAVLWDCAKHWQRAGDVDRAFTVARSFATHLMNLGLCTEAAQAYDKTFAFCTSDHQRLEILQSQAHAYFRASDWANLSTAAGKVRDFRKRFERDTEVHDDIELMEMRAAWQRGMQVETIAKTLRCLRTEDATLDHRCRAGIMALMLMSWTCDRDGMSKTYGTLRPLVEDEKADRGHRFEAGMVFETMCGDLGIVLGLARDLVAARRECESIADLMRALTNAATAARIAGHFLEARNWLREAITIADSHKLPLATEVPMQILASMALDDNDTRQAKEWHTRIVGLPRSTYNTESQIVRDYIGLRISLSERDVETAQRLVRSDVEALLVDPVAYSRAYGLSLVIAVQLANGDLPGKEITSVLEDSHLLTRKNARQDFATFVLVSALRRLGRRTRANQLLTDYLNQYRREPSEPPLHILNLLESFPTRSARH